MSGSLLDKVNNLDDLKNLKQSDLNDLCDDIRAYILSVVSKNGGHLASNLGVVELTVALEYVFDARNDVIVWDVGHQTYTHKILTGRKDSFRSLREWGGLSGFPKRSESACDRFDSGHSSNSIAAALGFAQARDLKGDKHKVVALIGDGSMTGGQAFEALNLAGELELDMLVILNDNHMSIAPNIGGISRYLTRLRASAAYTSSKQVVRRFLRKIPLMGNALIRIIEIIKDSLRYLMVNGVVFSELGFKYYGPVDGHNIKSLIESLNQVKDIKGPVLLHVVTQKGRGYDPAMKNATEYHGIAPFDLRTGKTSATAADTPVSVADTSAAVVNTPAIATASSVSAADISVSVADIARAADQVNGQGDAVSVTFTRAFSEALTQLARENPRIVAVTAAMADGTGLEIFRRSFPDRFFDTGIAEQTAVTFATALALSGLKPVVAIYSSFLQRAFDQLMMDTALQNAPVVFAVDRGGLVGEDGPTHHGAFDLSYLNQIPNMSVMMPRDEVTLTRMLSLALARADGPVAIRYPKGTVISKGIIKSENEDLSWGKGQLIRAGDRALVIAAGPLVYEAIKAAESFENEGVSIAVYDPCFLKPIDAQGILSLAREYDLIITIEENVGNGGLGQVIAALLASNNYRGRLRIMSIPDSFVPHGSQKELRKVLSLDAEGLIRVMKAELSLSDPAKADL